MKAETPYSKWWRTSLSPQIDIVLYNLQSYPLHLFVGYEADKTKSCFPFIENKASGPQRTGPDLPWEWGFWKVLPELNGGKMGTKGLM